eukprot:gene26364-biopygen16109
MSREGVRNRNRVGIEAADPAKRIVQPTRLKN